MTNSQAQDTAESNTNSSLRAENAANATPDAFDGYGEHIEVDDPAALHEIRALRDCVGCQARNAENAYLIGVINKLQKEIASLRADIDAHECSETATNVQRNRDPGDTWTNVQGNYDCVCGCGER